MKAFTILSLLAGLCAAAKPAQTTAEYQSLIDSELLISNGTTDLAKLIVSFSGTKAEACALQAQAAVVDSSIKAGAALVLTLPPLSDVQSAGLLNYFGTGTIGLATLINKTITQTIAAKPAFVAAGTGAVVLFTLKTLNASSAIYANEIVALVPAGLQGLAQSAAITPIFNALANGISAYADQAGGPTTVDCSVTTTSSSSSSVPATSTSTSASSSTTGDFSSTSTSTASVGSTTTESASTSFTSASLSSTSFVSASSTSGSSVVTISAPYPTGSSTSAGAPSGSMASGGSLSHTQEGISSTSLSGETGATPTIGATTSFGVDTTPGAIITPGGVTTPAVVPTPAGLKPSSSLTAFEGAAMPTAIAGLGAAVFAAVGAFAVL